ncbi:MAG: hypothetical protein JWN62_4255 [Acidimicrobiales bacterium]|nr:hypothetical protein [Acidimicrobiales bacterium]
MIYVVRMDAPQYLATIAAESTALRAAAVMAGPLAQVPSCPGWTVTDLLRHVGEVDAFWATVVRTRASTVHDVARPPAVDDDAALEAFDGRLAEVLSVLGDADPSTPVWTWSDDHTVGFVQRRMAHETAIHRWDAEGAVGSPAPVAAELASDGIDEFLEHFLPDVLDDSRPVGGSVHIHCGDVAGEWTIHPNDGGYDVTREHAKGDCALRGSASDLLLVLWRRVGIETIDVVGDSDVAERFVAATNLH